MLKRSASPTPPAPEFYLQEAAFKILIDSAKNVVLFSKTFDSQATALVKLQAAIIEASSWSTSAITEILLKEAKIVEIHLLRAALKSEEEPSQPKTEAKHEAKTNHPSVQALLLPFKRRQKMKDKVRKLFDRGVCTTQLIFSGRENGRYVFWKNQCWEIDETTIARGFFKTVKKLRNIDTDEVVIGKRMVLGDAKDKDFEKRTLEVTQEKLARDAVKGIRNVLTPFCSENYHSERRGPMMFYIEPFASEGSPVSWWSESKWTSFTNEKKMSFILDAFRGVKDMHERKLVHGDLWLKNIVCSKEQAYVIDFGCTKVASEEEKHDAYAVDQSMLSGTVLDMIRSSEFPEQMTEELLEIQEGLSVKMVSVKEAYIAFEKVYLKWFPEKKETMTGPTP